MTDQNTTHAEKPLSAYDIMCIPFKEWEREFNAMNETARVGMNDVGRRVRYLASDGTICMGTLTAYDNQGSGVGLIGRNIVQRYQMRRVDNSPPRIAVRLELTRERAVLLMQYLIKSSIVVDTDGETDRDAMEPYWKVREDLVFELQRALGS